MVLMGVVYPLVVLIVVVEHPKEQFVATNPLLPQVVVNLNHHPKVVAVVVVENKRVSKKKLVEGH